MIGAILGAIAGAVMAWLWSGAVHAADMRRKQPEWFRQGQAHQMEMIRKVLAEKRSGRAA